MTFSPTEINAIIAFCQDIDNLSLAFNKARRFTISPPTTDDWLVVLDNENPALIKVTSVSGNDCVGEVMAALNTKTLQVGAQVTGFYNEGTTEWRYQDDDTFMLIDDYRLVMAEVIKKTSWFKRYSRLPMQIKSNNASLNQFLQDKIGVSPLKYQCELSDVLSWNKKRGEWFLLGMVGIQVFLLLTLTVTGSDFTSLILNVGCTLYSLYLWYSDVRTQRRIQKKFDKEWSKQKKEYWKLRDVIDRYGLSPNRIDTLRQWYMGTLSAMIVCLPTGVKSLAGSWYLRLVNLVETLNMEDAPDKQQATLDTLFALTKEYFDDVDKFQLKQY